MLGIIIGSAIAAASGGTVGLQRLLRGKPRRNSDGADASATMNGVVSVKEADRRAAAATAEANRANEFAALRRAVEDHHKDDEAAFARHESELQRLRDHRHEFDTWRLRMEFMVDELRREAGLITNPGLPGKPPPKPPRAR